MNDRLTYSGPTNLSIQFLKQDKVDSYAGFDELNFILGLDSFKPFLIQNNDDLKLTWVFTRDGQDGPQFPTTWKAWIRFFKESNVDFIVAGCNATSIFGYHFIEQRTATLSKRLAGIVLLHDTYGTHLDDNGKTTDPIT